MNGIFIVYLGIGAVLALMLVGYEYERGEESRIELAKTFVTFSVGWFPMLLIAIGMYVAYAQEEKEEEE